MYNATFHQRQDIKDLLMHDAHQILWLPRYSLDSNLIEKT
ncbi:hypothetical protein F975_02082 [Acinetobacter sp. ANC 3789]|nr:hypothetical protein F975_02082 [Acinetobacter sp. ANC 3789]